MVMQYSHNGRIIASLYAGVGVGLLLGNEYVIMGLSKALDADNIWFGVGLMSLYIAALVISSVPTAY
ncbi:YbfB/YjiJ family MFS transporter [Bartonella massiliensis]|uniref:YbfB/YjiJ family MFS transporter n=1 Tax=Bartonella massiliensis TaxID=929795 RepID=UPI0024829A31|nr:YbfB/YjiJ family MFS transporter [Bartonella massiliensis]